MYSSRAYNENYYLSRKKILQDFLKDEENDTMKYIEDIESLVSSTKAVLKSMVSGDIDCARLTEKLLEIESDLNNDCKQLEEDIITLDQTDKKIEQTTQEMQKLEEKGTASYLERIEELKKELESKEFSIQNMERLYVELENIIKDNIQKGNEQLLSLEQFAGFMAQNVRLKEECDRLEEEKKECLKDYNNLLKENLNLRSKDESFELEKIKDALVEISAMGTIQKEAEEKIGKLQTRLRNLNDECEKLTNQIMTVTKSLQSLNIDNHKLNKELININRELIPGKKRLNKSFSEIMEDNESENDNTKTEGLLNEKKKKKNKHTKSTLV